MPSETCVSRAWRSHQSELLRFLHARLRDPAEAADLLQDVFLKALRQGRDFCELSDPRAWLFSVARNALIDHVRGRRTQVDLPDNLATIDQQLPPVDDLAECLPIVMERLQPGDRDVLEQCELGAMTQREYAATRGISLAAAKSRVLRARARMREVMTEVCGVRFDPNTGTVCCHVCTLAPSHARPVSGPAAAHRA
jgi:RNA polymerase sigma-70 factor (ECF subfamily)